MALSNPGLPYPLTCENSVSGSACHRGRVYGALSEKIRSRTKIVLERSIIAPIMRIRSLRTIERAADQVQKSRSHCQSLVLKPGEKWIVMFMRDFLAFN